MQKPSWQVAGFTIHGFIRIRIRREKWAYSEHDENIIEILLATLLALCFLEDMSEKAKRKLNVRLLRRIQKHILEEPRRFFMDGFMLKRKTATSNTYYGDDNNLVEYPPCGTVACIAGWANLLHNNRPNNGLKTAARLIGLLYTEDSLDANESDRLFFVGDWPHRFRVQYGEARTPRMRARIAVRRIEHLIKTGE